MPLKHLKKTLLALIALAGVAGAEISESKMDEYIDGFITSSGYEAGDSFTLTLNVSNPYKQEATNFIQLSGGYYIFSNADKHYAFSNSSNGNDIVWPSTDAKVTVPDKNNKTVTMNVTFSDTTSNSNTNNFWFAYKGFDASGNPTKDDNGYMPNGGTVELAYAEGVTTISISKPDVITNVLRIEGYTLNATDIEVVNNTSFTNAVFTTGGTTYTIPEPTTATLSLLALAGLAARRRRASR